MQSFAVKITSIETFNESFDFGIVTINLFCLYTILISLLIDENFSNNFIPSMVEENSFENIISLQFFNS